MAHCFQLKYFQLKFLQINLLFAVTLNCFAQTSEEMLKAAYIEKFTHFVQWPDSSNSEMNNERFVISIFGNSELETAMRDIFAKANIQEKRFEIRNISSVDQIKGSRVLFIPRSEKNFLDEILSYTYGKPILTISDTNGFGERGVIINLFLDGNYVRYQVNRNSMLTSGLIINSLLLSYAQII